MGFSHWELVPTAQALSPSGKWCATTMLFLSPQLCKGHTELRKARLHFLSALRTQSTYWPAQLRGQRLSMAMQTSLDRPQGSLVIRNGMSKGMETWRHCQQVCKSGLSTGWTPQTAVHHNHLPCSIFSTTAIFLP